MNGIGTQPLSRHGRAWHVRVFDDYPSSEELSRSPGLSAQATGIPLLRPGLLIYIRPWSNAFKAIPDSSQRLERFERSAARERLERLEPGIR